MTIPMRILYCHCAYAQVVPPETKTAVLDALSASGIAFDAVPDLCEMSARRDPALAQIARQGEHTVVACFPRAVRWLFTGAGHPLAEGVRVLNMREANPAEILSALGLSTEEVKS